MRLIDVVTGAAFGWAMVWFWPKSWWARKPRPRSYPPLGNYGPDNRDLPDVSNGWHIFADGNMWCAVGPAFENLQESPAGFGATPQLAHEELLLDLERAGVAHRVNKPSLMDFEVHYPTAVTNVG